MDPYITIEAACDLFLKEAKKKHKPWSKGHRPKGWTEKSVKQYSNTMMEDEEHPFTECVKKMKKHLDNPEGFCASVKDIHEKKKTWRNPPKKKNKK